MIRGMIRVHVVILLLAVVFLPSPCHCQDSQDRAALASILDVMSRAHLSGSLQYCNLPANTTPPGPSTPPLQALREMLADNKDMQVTQAPDGTIRMVEKTVPQDLLNVKIGHISFDEEQKKKTRVETDFGSKMPIRRNPKILRYTVLGKPTTARCAVPLPILISAVI
jgi:hypothetical protein